MRVLRWCNTKAATGLMEPHLGCILNNLMKAGGILSIFKAVVMIYSGVTLEPETPNHWNITCYFKSNTQITSNFNTALEANQIQLVTVIISTTNVGKTLSIASSTIITWMFATPTLTSTPSPLLILHCHNI